MRESYAIGWYGRLAYFVDGYMGSVKWVLPVSAEHHYWLLFALKRKYEQA